MLAPTSCFALLFALTAFACKDDEAAVVPLRIVAPEVSSAEGAGVDATAREDALAILVATLQRMGHDATVERRARLDDRDLARVSKGADLVIVLDADRLGRGADFSAAGSYPPAGADPRFDDRFAITTERADPGDRGALVVGLSARSTLGRFYVVYELLRRLGARYYHPEDEWIPRVPAAQLASRAATPTVLGPGPVYTPDFTHRSFSFHGAHPLEHLEAFSDGRFPIDEALHVNDWIIKNRGDIVRGPGRGIAPEADAARRRDELEAFRARRTLRYQAGITLHNQQQGATADIDPSSPEPVLDQIDRVVAERLAAAPDAYGFGIHFGPTELTTTPDLPTLAQIDRAGAAALAIRPDLQVEINDHTTGTQPVDHMSDLGCPPGTNDRGVADYYDLAFHADPRLAARVHTVMFPPLEGPAGVYQQKSFAHKLCLMEKASAAGRPLVYFPEGAYWLSWDNAVPVYLPLYLWTRQRDMELLQPLLAKNGGTLRDHRLFDSGHEWGYWQVDYGVGLLHWKSDLGLDEILGELADPLCDADHFRDCPARTTYIAALRAVMAAQADAFLTRPDFRGRAGGLYTYFAGEDPADEIGARSGLEFRPVRIAFRDVVQLSDAQAERFAAVDLAGLSELEALFRAQRERLMAIAADVPTDGRPWLDEVVDGLEIDELRALHTERLYRAVLALRSDDDPAPFVGAAADALARAAAVIARREAHYRYPAAQEYGGGLTPDTAVANGTTYPFRVHTKTHLLTYWTGRQAQVEDLVAGGAGADGDAARVRMTPVFAAPDALVSIAWPTPEAIGALTLGGSVAMGDGAAVTPADASHRYAAAGIYRIEGALETSDAPLAVGGWIVRSDVRATIASGGFALTSPDSEVARSVLRSLVPTLRVALAGDGDSEGDAMRVALLAEPAGPDSGAFDEVVVWPAAIDGDAFSAGPGDVSLPFPDPASGLVAARVEVRAARLSGPADLAGPLELRGELSVGDLVDALIALAGFEADGALATLSGVLGFDPETPPETVPFVATLTVE